MGQPNKCVHCRRHFRSNPRVKNQSYCGCKECQRARKSKWQQKKMASDPDYRINQQDSQKNWCRQNPDYWRKYRSRNRQYCERNRQLQKCRDERQRARLAKMDALMVKAASRSKRLNPFLIRSQLRTIKTSIQRLTGKLSLNPFLIRSQLRTNEEK